MALSCTPQRLQNCIVVWSAVDDREPVLPQVERWGWTASTRHLREQQYRTAINSYRRKHLCVCALRAHVTRRSFMQVLS